MDCYTSSSASSKQPNVELQSISLLAATHDLTNIRQNMCAREACNGNRPSVHCTNPFEFKFYFDNLFIT